MLLECRGVFDAMKAMIRGMIEINNNPIVAYAIHKKDRIVTTEMPNTSQAVNDVMLLEPELVADSSKTLGD